MAYDIVWSDIFGRQHTDKGYRRLKHAKEAARNQNIFSGSIINRKVEHFDKYTGTFMNPIVFRLRR